MQQLSGWSFIFMHVKTRLWNKTGIALLTMISLSPLKAEENIVESFNQTGMFLYYIMDKSSNTIISPFSISSSLLMAYMGSRGKTAQEIRNALRLTAYQDQIKSSYREVIDRLGKKAKVGLSLWLEKEASILSSYRNIVEKDFRGSIEKLDFTKSQSAALKMNEWIRNHSKGKISHFIESKTLTPSTKMILLNTLLIQGSWEKPFPTQQSGSAPFKTLEGNIITCKMMNQKSTFLYFEDKDTQIIALPIEGLSSNVSFIVFLPKEKNQGLYDFYYSQDESRPEGFISYLSHLEKKTVDLTLPKFTVSQKLDLGPFFRSLGINSALNASANFSAIDGAQDLYISQALHQSTLSIDEEGIFAAAGSSIAFNLKTLPEPSDSIKMNVNHPFLYAIYDFETNLLLFLGECLNPIEQTYPMEQTHE